MADEPRLFPERASQERSKILVREEAFDPSGYRSRLRKRLLEGGTDARADHKLIEYPLTLARPRIVTKQIARSLIQRFGLLAGVLMADPRKIALYLEMGESSAAALRTFALAVRRLARQQASELPVLGSWQALIDYLAINMAHLTVERVRLLYLNIQNRLILDQHVGEGSIDEAAIHPREVISKALDIGPMALILVHNHPSGSPQPSRADIQIIQRIIEGGRLLDVTVHEHVIIGRESHVSLNAKGLI
jgi:DNA repair protein RadC